ncbi:hypothetical protein BRARA_J01684 [Brassica rapa]|uniref:Uncharacterized protein n=1 Tax=Brassica campestris TaxID=3711 RepID=A0A397XL55_BRACM|nr:hypothetical protein BRARA_J01684 [Brassica rapa]
MKHGFNWTYLGCLCWEIQYFQAKYPSAFFREGEVGKDRVTFLSSFEFAGSCRTNEVNDCKNLIKTLVMRAESWQNYPLTLVILYLKINMFFFLICVQE